MSGSALSPVYPASTLNTLRNAKQIAAQLQCFAGASASGDAQRHHQSSTGQFKAEKTDKDSLKDGLKDSLRENFKDGSYSYGKAAAYKEEAFKEKSNGGKSSKEHKSGELLECLRRQKLEKLMDLQVKQPQFLFKYSPTMEGILFPTDPVKVMADKQSTFLQYDLMIGMNSAPLHELYSPATATTPDPLLGEVAGSSKANGPPALGGPINEERRDKIIRTLVRNLYTYHLQVSLSLSLSLPFFPEGFQVSIVLSRFLPGFQLSFGCCFWRFSRAPQIALATAADVLLERIASRSGCVRCKWRDDQFTDRFIQIKMVFLFKSSLLF